MEINKIILTLVLTWASLGFAQDFKAEQSTPSGSFNQPVFLTYHPVDTDKLLVVEKGGKIYSYDKTKSFFRKELFIDLNANGVVMTDVFEQGLLGLAFDPNYSENKRFYVYYSKLNPRRSVISRFTTKSNNDLKAELESEKVILEVPQPEQHGNHKGGMLTFGPDKKLYIGLGDGGGAGDCRGNSQNLSNRLGSILRIDVDVDDTHLRGYEVPRDNPFISSPIAQPEIYSYGLRNPWRFSFDSLTGELYVADVGQVQQEEINIVNSGDNMGWNVFEGDLLFNQNRPGCVDHSPVAGIDYKDPILTLGRTESISITGGYVYRGSKYPELVGKYLFGDFGFGSVWAINKNRPSVKEKLFSVPSISSFGEDSEGDIYIVSIQGQIFKLVSND